jgi:hypothetical protein
MFRGSTWGWVLPVFALVMAGCEDVRIPDPNVRYVAFGDSSTAGPTDVDYPQALAEVLGAPDNEFANEGRGGETTAEGVERLNGLISNGIFPNAHTLLYWEGGGDVVSFLRESDPFLILSPESPDYPLRTGLTQTLDAAQANIEAAIAAGQSAGWRVFVATYPLRPSVALQCDALPIPLMLPGQAVIANSYNELINERIRAAAANTGATLVDLAADPRLAGTLGTYVDCNHLSAPANEIVAEVFAAALGG